MTEEERRRRLGIQTTPEYEDYLIRVAQARAAGLPDPAPLVGVPTEEAQPTSRAAMMQPGEQRLIRPYVDPRDEMIASSPALVRPVYSILDRMLRPGRAGMADRMNREYMEGLLQRDADQRMSAAKLQEQQAKAAYADIERRAAEGDTDALEQIEALSKARYAGRSTGSGTPDYASQLIETFRGRAGGQTSGDRPPMIPTPEGAKMPMRRAEPANPYANLSAEDARALYDSRIAEIDTTAQQQIDSAPLSSVAPVNLKNLLFDSDVPSGGPADTVRQAEALKALNLRQLREYHPNVAPQL
jgi:hypothetical protein